MHRVSGKQNLLSVTGATRRFDSRIALSNVDLSLCPGEIFVLLGPNGAGKTTLLRAIAGRLRLDSGTVRIDGRIPHADLKVRRQLGVVPQSIAIYPYMTARENLEVFGILAGISRRHLQQAVNEALSWTELTDRADDRASTLSGGMQRRLNIAASILQRPKVLLLDEPTVGVDPRARETIHKLLQRLRQWGLSILITTHDLGQAEELADRVGILVDGQIRAEGNPAELIRATFGNAKDLIVTLSYAPGDRGYALLESEGLIPMQDQRIWIGRLRGELVRRGSGPAPLIVVSDPARGVAVPMLAGQIQKAYFASLPDVALSSVVAILEASFLELNEQQQMQLHIGFARLRENVQQGRETGWRLDRNQKSQHNYFRR